MLKNKIFKPKSFQKLAVTLVLVSLVSLPTDVIAGPKSGSFKGTSNPPTSSGTTTTPAPTMPTPPLASFFDTDLGATPNALNNPNDLEAGKNVVDGMLRIVDGGIKLPGVKAKRIGNDQYSLNLAPHPIPVLRSYAKLDIKQTVTKAAHVYKEEHTVEELGALAPAAGKILNTSQAKKIDEKHVKISKIQNFINLVSFVSGNTESDDLLSTSWIKYTKVKYTPMLKNGTINQQQYDAIQAKFYDAQRWLQENPEFSDKQELSINSEELQHVMAANKWAPIN